MRILEEKMSILEEKRNRPLFAATTSCHTRNCWLRQSAARGTLSLYLLALMVFMFSLEGPVHAQSTTADVLGAVSDSTGASVVGAVVKATSRNTGEVRTTVTDERGDYVINALQPGHYEIAISATGFKTSEVPDILLAAGDRARVDATLTVGMVRETVQVQGAPPLLETASSTVGTTLVEQSVQDLPLNGRNFVQLAQLTMGANEGSQGGLTGGDRPDDRRQTASISVNGQSDVLNDYLIDGADNNERIISTIGIRPSVDAISELRVQTNDYTAEVGRTAGGVINIITKSGGNQLHGTLFEYFRNDIFDASMFQFGSPLKKTELRQNQLGGSLGGALRKDKTFFFGDYEGFREIEGKTQSATTPSYQELTDPLQSDLATQYGLTSVNPIAANFLALFPIPAATSTCEVCLYTGTQHYTQNHDLFDVRVDNAFTPANLFFARFSYNNVRTSYPDIFPATTVAGVTLAYPGGNFNLFAGPSTNKAYNFQMNYSRVLSQHLLLNLVGSYVRIDTLSNPFNLGTNASTKFGLTGANLGTLETSSLTNVLIGGYGSLGDTFFLPLHDVDNTYQGNGTLTWTHGRQNMKYGASVIRREPFCDQNDEGVGWILSVFGGPQANLATFLGGIGELEMRGNQLTGGPHYRMWETGYFFQDDTKLSKHLTLNAGLRYDIFTPFTEAHNHISNFDPATDQLVIASSSQPTAGIETKYGNLAPRLGFAADLGKGMVVRGGYGISYFPSNYTAYASLKSQPFVSTFTGLFRPLSAGLPVPSTPVLDSNNVPMDGSGIPSSVPPNYMISSVQQFNLLVQKQLGVNVLTIGYVGILGRHLAQPYNSINNVPPGGTVAQEPYTPASCRPATSACSIGVIGWLGDEGSSNYNALQAAFQRRFAHGVAVDLNYAWAHGLDNVNDISDEPNKTNGAALAVATQYPRYDYGNSDLDIRHRIGANFVYQFPFGKKLVGVPAGFGKGWQLNILGAWQTGNPFTPRNSSVLSGTMPGAPGDAYDRPNQIGDPHSGSCPSGAKVGTTACWFNTSAIAAQTAGTLGNERVNQLYGPHFWHIDPGLSKSFPLPFREANLQFRFECFNVFNHPNLGIPDLTVQDGPGVFGAITSMNTNYSPREIQFALKLQF